MGRVQEHYSELLASVYVWMSGGWDAALAQGEAEVAQFGTQALGSTAVDLGAGFGMHAIPLARRGYSVIAIDTSRLLLDELQEAAPGLSIRAVMSDVSQFDAHLDGMAELILCMGDTLTHLNSHEAVSALLAKAAARLAAGGVFVATFRDYSELPRGDRRFILVRGDASRILTCFLEATEVGLRVHDILHERADDTWRMRVSSYPKLRLDPERVVTELADHGLRVERSVGPRGMVQVLARRE